MTREINVAEAKSRFSEIIQRAGYTGERFMVKRRGKPVGAIVSIGDLGRLESMREDEQRGGLVEAAGAWAGFEQLDEVVRDIYRAREKAVDRKVELS